MGKSGLMICVVYLWYYMKAKYKDVISNEDNKDNTLPLQLFSNSNIGDYLWV